MGLLTVSSVSRSPWGVMPQEGRRRSCDYDAIDPDFPPPSLRSPPTEGREQEKRKKKEKKWSIGGFFRRKKKVSDTDSSSAVEDEEEKKGFLERRRAARKRRNRGSKDVTGSFEHVIITPPRSQPLDTGSAEQIRNREACNERLAGRSQESLSKRQEVSHIKGSSVSLEGTGKKNGKTKTKTRTEVSRERLKVDSSSDEGGGSSRSSMQRHRSDETSGSKDGSLSRRSRAARTERYKKRLSRDEESLRDFQIGPASRISRSDERLSNKKQERAVSNSRWTAKVVYCESSDYDTKYTAKTKSATPSPVQSPKARPKNPLHYTASAPTASNYVTYPPSHAREGVAGSHQELRSHHTPGATHKANQRYADITPPRLPKSSSEMISKGSFPNSTKQYPSWGQDALNRKSASYDCNVNSIHYVNNQISQPHPTDENVLVVQFPISKPGQKVDRGNKLGNFSSQHLAKQSNPPPPPPRDPHRRLVPASGFTHETSPRPMSYAFEDRNTNQARYTGYPEFGSSISAFQRVPQTQPIDIQPPSVINKHHRSNSDHQILSRINSVKLSPPPARRSSSTQPETASQTHPLGHNESFASEGQQNGVPNHYQYYTDQHPRSRKPIQITYQNQKPLNDPYLSDPQVAVKPPVQQNPRARPPSVQNAADFWKQKDQETAKKVHLSEGSPKLIQRHLLNISNSHERSRSNSPHTEGGVVTSKLKLPPLIMPVRSTESSGSLSSQSSPREVPSPRTPSGRKMIHNEIGIPVFDTSEVSGSLKRDYRPLSMLEEKQEISEQEVSPLREKSNQPPVPPTRRDSKVNAVTSFEHFDVFSDENEQKESGRESSNLEDALNELEAIYKSLRLGEEGYLEKVAKEQAIYEKNRLDPSNWNAWVQSRGFESDSSFNYSRSSLESVDSVDSPRRYNGRRSGIPDMVTDDMAYRRLNKKDRPSPHEQEVISQAGSFLLVSPTLSPPPFIEPPPVTPVKNEPDVTLDDVVYRNIKHVNNSLKVLDPQPPFGIPLGPITPAPNSDYLHVTPKDTYRPTFKPRKTPDVVTDDLAFRNLRKDSNKEPLFSPEDTTLIDSPTLKKKRAVRSLSANLLSIIQRESLTMNNNNKLIYNNNHSPNDLEKSQSFSDVNSINGTSKEHARLYELHSKKNLSGEDSDVTPRVSRVFYTETSSPLIATSTETLTESKSSLWTPEPKAASQRMSQNASPRLSLTPERRRTTEMRKSVSPIKHVPIKIEPLKINFPANSSKTLVSDFRRSPTPDSHTYTHHKDIKQKQSPLAYNQTESELLAVLAREAKEASEQLSKELNELNFEKKMKVEQQPKLQQQQKLQKSGHIDTLQHEDERNNSEITKKNFKPLLKLDIPTCKEDQSKPTSFAKQDATDLRETLPTSSSQLTSSKPLPIGKITPHKPVKLNTFCITEDNKLENKQTIVSNSSQEIEGSKSMTDLFKELTKSLNLEYASPPKEEEQILLDKKEPSTDREEEQQQTDQETYFDAIEPRTTERKECEETYLPTLEETPEEKLTIPENSLLKKKQEELSTEHSFLNSMIGSDPSELAKFHEGPSLPVNELILESSEPQEDSEPIFSSVAISEIQDNTKSESQPSVSLKISDVQEDRTQSEQALFSLDVLDHRESTKSPENKFPLEISVPEPPNFPVPNRFPLEIPDDTEDPKVPERTQPQVPSEFHPDDFTDSPRPRPLDSTVRGYSKTPDHRSTTCSDLADEGSGGETCACAETAMVALSPHAQLSDWMDEAESARQQRIARYKEERRRQLAAQYGPHRPQDTGPAPGHALAGGGVTVRTTRASRLRSAATTTSATEGKPASSTGRREVQQLNGERRETNGRLGPTHTATDKNTAKEKSPTPVSDSSSSSSVRRERDKSAKRKSNLNRSQNAEPLEDVVRRRRSLASPGQSPIKSPRPSPPASTIESTPLATRGHKRSNITPPRDTPRPRPRSSSGLLERSAIMSPVPDSSVPVVNGGPHPAAPSLDTQEAPELPDVVVLPARRSSILKKKSLDETATSVSGATHITPTGKPVSILKRKTSQEEGVASTVQPVTFSPSVVEHTSSRRQGILKKHRSLDEGSVRRSMSPILKQRRSSLEEVRRRTHSPEPQSILKRKTSREEGAEPPTASEPQGILKRKTSCGSSGPVHVTIAESVIMAVAGEESLNDDHVRPILKKKTSICEEPPGISQDNCAQGGETPRPILKKKSSSETDEGDEKPKKTILKSRRDSRRVSEGRTSFTDLETVEACANENSLLANGNFCENSESPSALSARAESSSPERFGVIRRIPKQVDADFSEKRRLSDNWVRFSDQEPQRVRAYSVAERILNMESFLTPETQRPRSLSPSEVLEGKGAVPKRIRDRERYRTQPVTVEELTNIRSWSREEAAMQATEGTADDEPQLHGLARSESVSARASLFEAQLKQQQEETKPKRIPRGSAARRVKPDPSRFQTQPVTQDEVEEAKRVNESSKPSSDSTEEDDPHDPSKLSLAERVKLFNQKMVTERLAPRPISRSCRHKTQPVTTEEVETAQKLTPISRTASSVLVSGILKNLTEKNEGPKSKIQTKPSSESEEEAASEPSSPVKRGILKSPSQGLKNPKAELTEESDSLSLKSVLKKENKKQTSPERRSKDLHSILKVSKERESSSSEETESESEDDKPNANSDLIDLLHKVEAQARGERKKESSPERKKSSQVVTNNKKPEEADKLMNLKNLDHGKENYDVSRKARRKKTDELSEGDSSSSGGREVRKIIGNEAVARRRQAGLVREAAERAKRHSCEEGSLSKSRSHSAMNGEVALRPPGGLGGAPLPLRRSRTQPMDECDEPKTNGVSIAQRLEALQKRGQTDWKKRVSRLNPEEDLPPTININAAAQVLQERLAAPIRAATPSDDLPPTTTPLDERLGQLETSAQGWKKRINPTDAVQFSVAGRMAPVPVSPLHSPAVERRKKTPKPERFKSKATTAKDVQSMPTSPEAETTTTVHAIFKRSVSAPGEEDNSLSSGDGEAVAGPRVSVPKAFDEDFTNFFASNAINERIELRDEDLEQVTSSTSLLLGQRKTVKVHRRRGASTNPVKALAARTDLRTEYIEVKSGVAQREEKRLRIEKLANNSHMAVEALAGLASQEDFAAVTLRNVADSTAHLSPMLPYKDLMLLQVKGRRHVQTRLVNPHYSSVNQGDTYVLVTSQQVFLWVGEFSNVIERSRGAEIAQHVAVTRDLGCGASAVTTANKNNKTFWRLLGADDETAATYTGAPAGHPDEDELYELALTDTNMVYEVQEQELVPREDSWGVIPKIEILDHNKALVFDFGSELYVWMGKNVSLDRRRATLRLGQELWAQGYDYTECDVCPLTQAELLGTRTGEKKTIETKAPERPEWALLAKVTQHMETVLLREKFLDWPDFSRVIQVKNGDKDRQVDGSVEVKPCDAQPMIDWTLPEPDLQLEGSHLGRGSQYYDPETHRHFEISTLSVTAWHVQEFDSSQLDDSSLAQLHAGDSYVIRWCYSVTVSGRELSGQPSRHSTVGRDRCCYFTWQGHDASTNDKGAAALITVQLDQERGPQLRLTQGSEPPAFRQLFNGGLIIHQGRRCDGEDREDRWRLYLALGEEEKEAVLIEVPCSMRQLRSRACLVLLDTTEHKVFLWRGNHTHTHTHKAAKAAVERLKESLPAEAGLEDVEELKSEEITEGKEPKLFFEALGGNNRQLYVSLPLSSILVTYSPRLFRLSSVSGEFTATPVPPASCHADQSTPFPYNQHELYSARQPALFLLDAGACLWLWQGWWGEERGEAEGEVRWQAERRAAMHTTLEYQRLRSAKAEKPSAHLVWAGLEPLAFTNLFPTWSDRDDVAEINIRDGHKPGELMEVQSELERLTVSTYPPAVLLQRPLPAGVDPTRLEAYLTPHHFQEVLGMSKEEFLDMPAWKQNKLKQEKGLF